MKKSSKTSITTKYIILFGAFFLLANLALGVVLHRQAKKIVEGMIRNSMLNVANTAADLIDGDVIGAFTEEDVGSEPYNEILDDLRAFLENTDVEYIYAVRQVGPEKYVFVVDSDPEDPGLFGEEVLYTEALRKGGEGIAAIDDEPAQDQWGNFYSAYSPIFDSKGKVAGIVGVDFSSSWYDDQIWRSTIFVIVVSVLFTLVGIVGFILLGIRVRQRFADLNKELSVLSGDMAELTKEISGYLSQPDEVVAYHIPEEDTDMEGDEIRTLSNRIHSMHKELGHFLEYMRAQANTDGLTAVGNTRAYMEQKREIEASISDNTAAFSVIMFDINDLKYINDRYGHVGGDRVIRATADIIAAVHGRKNTYRIGGDEFIAVSEPFDEEEASRRAKLVEELIADYNNVKPEGEAVLSVSQGWATFVPGRDHSFSDVFVRADEEMYERKDQYHHRDGNTRKK